MKILLNVSKRTDNAPMILQIIGKAARGLSLQILPRKYVDDFCV